MTLLLLAGTGDARQIANDLQGYDIIASLSGATRMPKPLAVKTRQGGFGGTHGFRAFLQGQNIRAVLDATHPYAARMTARTAAVCADLDLPYLQFLRPPWLREEGDNWTNINREQDAAARIPMGATVFLGTGRQRLEQFANLYGRQVICRRIDPPSRPFPFDGGQFLVGQPPFSVSDEVSLFEKLGVDWLVVKNAGGTASKAKLIAARQLHIPVLMIARPALGSWPTVGSVAAAVDWAKAQ